MAQQISVGRVIAETHVKKFGPYLISLKKHETCDGISIWIWNKTENIKIAQMNVHIPVYRFYINIASPKST